MPHRLGIIREFKTQNFHVVVDGGDACECSDPGCPVHKGISSCSRLAITVLYRVDMEDRTGTAMCEGCASDAFESGLFTDTTDEDDTDEQE